MLFAVVAATFMCSARPDSLAVAIDDSKWQIKSTQAISSSA